MKSMIFFKFLFIFITLSWCNASGLIDMVNDFKDSTIDYDNYSKVINIEKDIKFNESRELDVYYNKDEVDTLKPVVIHIYGGTWKKGNKIKFNKIGSLLEENGYVAVLPNYGLFPFSFFEDMVYDVYTAINWTFNNIRKYGGDPNRVTLIAHSAGAHLSALTLFKSYNYMENNGFTLQPLPPFEKVILLAGPFDFDDFHLIDLIKKENDEGEDVDVDTDNGLVENLVKVLFRTKNVSPHDIVKSMMDNSVKDSFNVKKFIFYYTAGDQKVPKQSAEKLMAQMKRVCPTINIDYIYNTNNYAHSDIVNGPRFDDQVQEDIYMSLIRL